MAHASPPDPNTVSRHHAVVKKAPKLTTNKTFTFWRRRTQQRKPKRALTAGDRLVQAKKREQYRLEYRDALEEGQATIRELAEGLRNRFGKYSVEHYYNELIHRAHTSRSVRKVNGWNAYQKLELERMKSEAGEDVSQINLTEVNKQISEKWKTLSPVEREDITAEAIQRIEEQRVGKKLTAHSVPLNAFHDARSTLQSIETQLAQLNARTGLEYLLVACRSTTEDFIKPYAYYSSDTILGFFNSSMKRSVDDFSLQIEAYVMSGLKGIVENSKLQTLDLKKRTAALIGQKLRAITGVADLRMQYDRFDDLITEKYDVVTEKYDVVIKNWPLGQKFRNPSVALTRIELGVLLNSWESGATRFVKLSAEEKRAWKNEHFSSKVTMMSLPPAASIPSASSASPALNPITLSPSASTELPATLSQVSVPAEMVLFTELAEQVAPPPTSNDAEITLITPSTTQLPAPPELLAEIIRLDPTLQAIDPALIMAGVTQGFHHPTTVSPVSTLNNPPLLSPPITRKKRDRGAFEVVTPELFGTRMAKVPRKGQKDKRAKKSVAGRENIPLVEGTGGQ